MKKQELKEKVKTLKSEVDNLNTYLYYFTRANQELREQIEELKTDNSMEKLYEPINVFGDFFTRTINQSELTPEQEILKALNSSIDGSGLFKAKIMSSIIETLRDNEKIIVDWGNYAKVVKEEDYLQIANSVLDKLKDD